VFDKFVHPSNKWLELTEIVMLMALYVFLLFATRVVPVYHRAPLWHIASSMFRRRPHGFDRQVALKSLGPRQRRLLREAVVDRLPVEALDGSNGVRVNGGDGEGAQDVEPERLVKILRKAGAKGGIPVGKVTQHDARIAKFLFADSPTAARNATMRGLVSAGADANDLRALEDLVEYLSRTPKSQWRGKDKGGGAPPPS